MEILDLYFNVIKFGRGGPAAGGTGSRQFKKNCVFRAF